jgi:serine-type D-Ala-D-Ala carboxypeptidase (penicillin-binding protein 5/6)
VSKTTYLLKCDEREYFMFENIRGRLLLRSSMVLVLFLATFQLGTGAAVANIEEAEKTATESSTDENLTVQEKLELYTQELRDNLSCLACVVMDAKSGKILFSQNPTKRMAPASLTKMLTAILTIENGDLDRIVEIKHNISMRSDAVKLDLKKGDRIKMKALLYAAMIHSACDACDVLAEEIAGSKAEFTQMMNAKAREIGAIGSNFKNSHGLPDKNHYTCAYDLAVIARYCMQNPLFRKLVSTKRVTLSYSTLKTKRTVIKKKPRVVSEKIERGTKTVTFTNSNKLLFKNCGVNGIKTGYTREAGRCLVTNHSDGVHNSIVVVLKDSNTLDDTLELISYANLKRAVAE